MTIASQRVNTMSVNPLTLSVHVLELVLLGWIGMEHLQAQLYSFLARGKPYATEVAGSVAPLMFFLCLCRCSEGVWRK